MQRIQIEEIHDYSTGTDGVLKHIDCELKNDLIHSCHLGDCVSISGILKPQLIQHRGKYFLFIKQINIYAGKVGQSKGLFGYYVDVNFIEIIPEAGGEEGFSQDEIKMFQFKAVNENMFSVFMKSLSPSLFGHFVIYCFFNHSG